MMPSQWGWRLGYYCLPIPKIKESLLDVDLSMYTAKAWLYIGTGFTWFSTDEKFVNLM